MDIEILTYIFGCLFVLSTMIGSCWIKFYPPKSPKNIIGFKTKATTKSQETWEYAHKFLSNALFFYSIFSVILFVIIISIKPQLFIDLPILRAVFGLILGLFGWIVSLIVTQIKTRQYIKLHNIIYE